MKRDRGFTLIEVVVAIAIVGILSATAIPFYTVYRQRTYGSEAKVMIKLILDAEIAYYLENDTFYPPNFGDLIQIFHNDPPDKQEITDIKNALNIIIPVRHKLDFEIRRFPDNTGVDAVWVRVGSAGGAFALFSDGSPSITGSVNTDGRILP